VNKVTVELRYDYGTSRWTPIEIQKHLLTLALINFTQVVYIIPKKNLYFAKDISVISLTKKSLIFVCYRETPGLCRPTSVIRRSDTVVLPPNRGVSGHTVAPPDLQRECTVANRSITGTYRVQVMSETGPGP